jgi:hypothetical protein
MRAACMGVPAHWVFIVLRAPLQKAHRSSRASDYLPQANSKAVFSGKLHLGPVPDQIDDAFGALIRRAWSAALHLRTATRSPPTFIRGRGATAAIARRG